MKKVRITLIKGTVRRLPMHRANVAALGLRKIGQSVEHVLTPSIQGMINALNTLNPGKAAKGKSRKRIGRGPGSGWGTTAGRGQKGAGARKSAQAGRVAFEGGQMPIHRRIPKRGFKSHFAKDTQIVNLKKLASCSVTDFDAQAMFDQGFIKNIELPIKVLAFGTIDKAINVKVNAISEKAKAMIEAAGGKVEIV